MTENSYMNIGAYNVPRIDGYDVAIYHDNLVVYHGDDIMVVEAFSKPRAWTPFHDVVSSMHAHEHVDVSDGDMLIHGVVVTGIDDGAYFSRAYILGRDTGSLRDFYHRIEVDRGDAPMPPLTRLTASVKHDDKDDGDGMRYDMNVVLNSIRVYPNM